MKSSLIIFFSAGIFFSGAQLNKTARMEPILTNGYYINLSNDTIRGMVQVNPPSKVDFYMQFSFLAPRAKKPKLFTTQRAKAYGYDNRHFVLAEFNSKKVFIERLATGRLRFYELRYNGNAELNANLESVYFIKDTEAENAEQKKLNKIKPKFYKRNLKPFMTDQLKVWKELDKYNFNEQNIISAVNQFNSYYK